MLTTCTTLLVLPRKLPSPAYSAVTVFEPCGSELVISVATPLVSSATGSHSATPLVLNSTVPVGIPVTGGTALTVAVKRHIRAWQGRIGRGGHAVGCARRIDRHAHTGADHVVVGHVRRREGHRLAGRARPGRQPRRGESNVPGTGAPAALVNVPLNVELLSAWP